MTLRASVCRLGSRLPRAVGQGDEHAGTGVSTCWGTGWPSRTMPRRGSLAFRAIPRGFRTRTKTGGMWPQSLASHNSMYSQFRGTFRLLSAQRRRG